MTVRAADADEARLWRAGLPVRIEAWYGRHGALAMGLGRLADWDDAPGEVFTLVTKGGEAIGSLALAARDNDTVICDVWVAPENRRRGHGRAALTFAEQWASGRSTRVAAQPWGDDPAAAALFGGYQLRSQKMIKELDMPTDLPQGVVARPMAEAEYEPWKVNDIAGYAADLTNSGLYPAEAAAAYARRSYDELLPIGLATVGHAFWMVDADRETVAAIWLHHHESPGVSYVYSVETRPEHRGRGYGRAAMLVGEAKSLAAGDRHIALNVYGHNAVAIRLYDSLGYIVLDQTRTT